jgi:hypothetical protein
MIEPVKLLILSVNPKPDRVHFRQKTAIDCNFSGKASGGYENDVPGFVPGNLTGKHLFL